MHSINATSTLIMWFKNPLWQLAKSLVSERPADKKGLRNPAIQNELQTRLMSAKCMLLKDAVKRQGQTASVTDG